MDDRSKSRLPGSVTILGETFVVRACKLPKNLQGDCDIGKREVRIKESLPPHLQYQTLWHEMVHAALGISGVAEMLATAEGDCRMEEAVVVALEHALFPYCSFRELLNSPPERGIKEEGKRPG